MNAKKKVVKKKPTVVKKKPTVAEKRLQKRIDEESQLRVDLSIKLTHLRIALEREQKEKKDLQYEIGNRIKAAKDIVDLIGVRIATINPILPSAAVGLEDVGRIHDITQEEAFLVIIRDRIDSISF